MGPKRNGQSKARVFDFDAKRPFSNETALQRIRKLWVEGCYIPGQHAEERMLERGFSDTDIGYLVLESGAVRAHRKVEGLWRYTVRGRSVDGIRMTAVFEIEGNFMILVTVI